MSTLAQSVLIIFSVVATYIWLMTPALSQYSLQAFAFSMICYFAIKYWRTKSVTSFLPDKMAWEISFASFGFLLLVGSTGNTQSLLFPLTYAHLFFLVFGTDSQTSIVGTIGIMLFHYSLQPILSPSAAVNLLSIPLMTLFFLFAKNQYDQVATIKKKVSSQETLLAQIQQEEASAETIVASQLIPDLKKIQLYFQQTMNNPELDSYFSALMTEAANISQLLSQTSQSETTNTDPETP